MTRRARAELALCLTLAALLLTTPVAFALLTTGANR